MKRGEEALEQCLSGSFRYTDTEWREIWANIGDAVRASGAVPPGRAKEAGNGWLAGPVIAGDTIVVIPETLSTCSSPAMLEELSRETLEEWISYGFRSGLNSLNEDRREVARLAKEALAVAQSAELLMSRYWGPPGAQVGSMKHSDPRYVWLSGVAEEGRRSADFYASQAVPPPSNNRWPLTQCWNAACRFWIEYVGREVDQSKDVKAFIVNVAAPFKEIASPTPEAARKYVRDRKKAVAV